MKNMFSKFEKATTERCKDEYIIRIIKIIIIIVIIIIIILKKMSWNNFDIQGQCDLDLWPSDRKINKGHLLVMAFVILNGFQDNQRKLLCHSRSLWPWPLI